MVCLQKNMSEQLYFAADWDGSGVWQGKSPKIMLHYPCVPLH